MRLESAVFLLSDLLRVCVLACVFGNTLSGDVGCDWDGIVLCMLGGGGCVFGG